MDYELSFRDVQYFKTNFVDVAIRKKAAAAIIFTPAANYFSLQCRQQSNGNSIE